MFSCCKLINGNKPTVACITTSHYLPTGMILSSYFAEYPIATQLQKFNGFNYLSPFLFQWTFCIKCTQGFSEI